MASEDPFCFIWSYKIHYNDGPMMKLLPPTKAQIKLWEKLRTAKTRRRENLFLAEGLKVVTELFKGSWDIEALLVREEKEGCWNTLEAGYCGKTGD